MIEVRLFGAIEALVDGEPVTGLTLKQRQVLAILALGEGTPVPREVLADKLWEGDLPRTWAGTLDSYVCVLRRALQVGKGRGSALATVEAGYVLRAEVDLAWFHRLARVSFDHHGHVAVDWAEEAFALVRADLLAEVPYAAWATRAREGQHRAHVRLGVESARRANGAGDHERAVRIARDVVGRDPVCEPAWTQVVLGAWLAGDHAQALAAYAEMRCALVERLGQEPGPPARELYQAVLTSAPDRLLSGGRVERLRTLLDLMRAELEQVPGLRVPVLDADLARCAARLVDDHPTRPCAPGPRSLAPA